MSKVKIIRSRQTSQACPSQWDAWDAEGQYYYLRYRYGHGEVYKYDHPLWYKEANPTEELITEFEYGDPLDGYVTLQEFCELADLELDGVDHEDFTMQMFEALLTAIDQKGDGSDD